MITEKLYQDYQKKLLSGNRIACIQIVKQLLEGGIQMKVLYNQLFQRSLYDVGYLWETNKVSVALEHLCTSITESLINLAYPYLFSTEHSGKKAVVICTPGEHHQVGARMVADYFELHGWDGYFLGINSPDNELFKFIEDNNPDVLAISMSVFFNLNLLLDLVVKIRNRFQDLKIIIGGQGFNWGGENSFTNFDNVFLLRTLDDMDDKIFNT